MVNSFHNWLTKSVSISPRRIRAGYALIWLLLMSPVVIVTSFSYLKMKDQLTALVLSRRESIASLSATTIQERLDRVVDLAKSMAGRSKFRQLVAKGDWEEAIRVIGTVPQEFSYVDQILLVDLNGVEKADAPKISGLTGTSFKGYDWYQGVIGQWKPYVSTVYAKNRLPNRNVIAVAVPVLADDETALGILVIEVRLETVLEWIRQIDVGPSGFVYVTDQKGKLVAHPRFSPHGKIVSFATDPSVVRALRGMQGVGVNIHPLEKEEQISAYTLVPKHGWVVVVAQPSVVAYVARNEALQNLQLIYGLFLLLTAILASVIVHFMVVRRRSEEMIRNLSLTDELTGLYNRRGFLTLAEEQLKLARRSSTQLTLFFADLDGLKEINDQFGHKEGDIALIDIANILRNIFREGDVIARFAGDEYAVLMVSDEPIDGDFFVRRLEDHLYHFNMDGGRRYALSLSVGHGMFDAQRNPSIDNLMSLADQKLYELKRTRKILNDPFHESPTEA